MMNFTFRTFVPLVTLHFRSFKSSSASFQRPDHRLYKLVDWDRIEAGEYAIVDPLDPNHVLHLSEKDYIVQVRVAMTNASKPIVLATPSDSRPSSSPSGSDSSPKTPPSRERGRREQLRAIRAMFISTFSWLPKVVRTFGSRSVKENLVIADERNLMPLFSLWAKHLWLKIVGLSHAEVISKDVVPFASHLIALLRAHGLAGLILRLKVYSFSLNAYVAGMKLKSTQDVGVRVRLTHGLPRALPASVRGKIRGGNKNTIRVWVSLLYIYKSMESVHQAPDFTGIAQPFERNEAFDFVDTRFRMFISEHFWSWFLSFSRVNSVGSLEPKEFHSSPNSGVNAPISLSSYPMDTLYWVFVGFKGSALKEYMLAIGSGQWLHLFSQYAEKVLSLGYSKEEARKIWSSSKAGDPVVYDESGHGPAFSDFERLEGPRHARKRVIRPFGGKLSLIKEASGKVRVVAIVDAWTQTLLKPLHDLIFKILRKVPTDGTFDQQAATASFAAQGLKDLYSFDLKAATDTIPWFLYQSVFECFLGEKITSAWLRLLRDREWRLPSWETKGKDGKTVSRPLKHAGKATVRYGRGQPMGAYSSWGALAVLHHAVVQYAAFTVGLYPFYDYRILGDDIVIAGRPVANAYRRTCGYLGIVIGLPKSYTSGVGFFNFANQSYLESANISPISFKQELSANTGSARLATAVQAIERGWIDIKSPAFFQQMLRFMLPPLLYKKVETSRKGGTFHEAARVCSNLIFQAALDGVAPFTQTEGLSVLEISSGLVNPGLSLFTMGLEKPGRPSSRKRKEWTGSELLLALIEVNFVRLEESIKKRIAELEGLVVREVYVGDDLKPDRENLYDEISFYHEDPPVRASLNLGYAMNGSGFVSVKYPEHVELDGERTPIGLTHHLLKKLELPMLMDLKKILLRLHYGLNFIKENRLEGQNILKMGAPLEYLLGFYHRILCLEDDAVPGFKQFGVFNDLSDVLSKGDSFTLLKQLWLSEAIQNLSCLKPSDSYVPWVSPSIDLARDQEIDNLLKPENQRLAGGQ